MLGASFSEIRAAFEQMSPAQFSCFTEIQLLDAILVRSVYTKHLQQFCLNKDLLCKRPINFWIDGIGQWQNQKKQFGYRDTTLGAAIGIDYCLPNLILGLAFSSTHDDCHLKNFASKATLDSYYGGFYSYWNRDGLYINAALIGAQNNYKISRSLHFATIDRRAHSKHSGNEWLLNFGLGYRACPSCFQWSPYVNLDFVEQHENSYAEIGADSLDLNVKAKNAALFQGEAGILLSTSYCGLKGTFVPTLTLAYLNQTPIFGKNENANFVEATSVFTGEGGNYERNLFAPGLTLTYKGFHDRMNASIYYDGEIGSSYWAQDVGLDLTFRF